LSEHIELLKISGIVQSMLKSYKNYPTCQQVTLPKVEKDQNFKTLPEVLVERRSCRDFKNQAISLSELAAILKNSYGLSGEFNTGFGIQHLRTVPSGGALYPLEIYVLANKIEDLDQALYHYRIGRSSLEKIKDLDAVFFDKIAKDWMLTSPPPTIIIISGVLARTMIKYKERAYRYVLMEAGMLGMNITLLCESIGFSTVMIGGYIDDETNMLIGLDGINEMALLPIAIGIKNDGIH
jgi:SagB-type dehydrogenase family enzyme